MSADANWERLRALFEGCLDRPEDERGAWLAHQCPDDPALRTQVLELLEDLRKGEALLGAGAVAMLESLSPEEDIADAEIGSSVGLYRLVRLLGKGGMGRVYLAERSDGQFAHQVALKLIRSDFATSELQQRFLRERNTLARLKHPNIAQLHDGGVSEAGLPFFTLELIDGTPITHWCDAHRSDLRTRMQLMRKVCDAVHHAHRNLIVHRDLKPSNILVTQSGEPKLLDFGIAKPLTETLDDDLTNTAAQPMTREYAAPEQVQGEPATTATDIYSLGVLLYLLACGRMPYRRAARGQIGWIKAILEDAPEPLERAVDRTMPSDATHSQLSPASSKKTTTALEIADARSVSLSALKRALRGDLERIVQRALAKSPEARYATVVAFADDLDAWLDGRALSGGTRTYRLRKFVRRHWLPLAAVAALLVAIIGGAAIIMADARKIEREARTTAAVKDFLVGLFRSADPEQSKGKDVTAVELVSRGVSHITAIKDQPLLRGELESVLGEIDSDLDQFAEAARLDEAAIADLRANGGLPLAIARSELQASQAHIDSDANYDMAAKMAKSAIERLRHIEPASAQELARALSQLAYISLAQHKFKDADAPSSEALSWAHRPGVDKIVLAEALNVAAQVASGGHDAAKSESLLREALDVRRSIGGDRDPAVAVGLRELAEAVDVRGHIAESFELRRQAYELASTLLGDQDPRLADIRRSYADGLRLFGRFQQAEEMLDKAESYFATRTDDGGVTMILIYEDRAQLRIGEGKYADAQANYLRLIEMSKRLFGAGSLFEQRVRVELSYVHALEGRVDEAVSEIAELETSELKKSGKNSMRLLLVAGDISFFHGDYAQAEQYFLRGLEISRALHGGTIFERGGFMSVLGMTRHKMKRDEEAESDLRQSIAILHEALGDNAAPSMAKTKLLLSDVLASQPSKHDEALTLAQSGVKDYTAFYGEGDPKTVEAKALLAHVTEHR
jgi:eukaryotic-like serine/threonine-protein kinase